jgi:2'-hydroxyisoflavone reductase
MRLLVLGGTRFLGRAVVDSALALGWQVTTLTRGESGEPPPAVDARHGDRTTPEGLAALGGGEWDVVVDTCGFVPRDVLASARALYDRAAHYVYVSSVSAYPSWPAQVVTGATPTHDCAPDAGPDDGDYGVLKAGCERAVTSVFGEAGSTIARAGLLAGPHDYTVRLPWWLARFARGGEVLAGGDPGQPMQLIDVRDLASWMLLRNPGAFVATSPPGSSTFGGLLASCARVTGSDARVAWVPDGFLTEAKVEPWTELPLWSPPADAPNTWTADSAPARATGLVARPIEETVADTWAWMTEVGVERAVGSRYGHGIDPVKEREVLAAWLGSGPSAER